MTDSALFERVATRIDGYRDAAIDFQRRLTAIPALDPASGGDGEGKKAALILQILDEIGIDDVELLKSPDPRVSEGYRPNILARIPGQEAQRTVWVLAHMDVVPAGGVDAWESDPWQIRVDGDRIYGRGVEDNQQGLVAALLLAKALRAEQQLPLRGPNLGLLFVSDEETGNQLGIEYVLDQHQPFKPQDIIVVPDGGESDGSMIEVSEKGILWLKFTVTGVSTHGSTPHRGVNAHLAAASLILALNDALHQQFDARDDLFDPPTSTFAVTKVDAGEPNINTIPGEHSFYLDCRALPSYELDEVLRVAEQSSAVIDKAQGTATRMSVAQRMDAAPPTPVDADVVNALERAVSEVYGVEAKPMGVGGGTVAACIRRKGLHAAVWSRMDETMHGPNEYCIISNLLGDAKVFAHLLLTAPC